MENTTIVSSKKEIIDTFSWSKILENSGLFEQCSGNSRIWELKRDVFPNIWCSFAVDDNET